MNYRDWMPDQIGPKECFIIYAIISMILGMFSANFFIMILVSLAYVAAANYIDKKREEDDDDASDKKEVTTSVFSTFKVSWRSYTIGLNVACVMAYYFTYKGSGSFFLGLLAFGCVFYFGYKHGRQHKVTA